MRIRDWIQTCALPIWNAGSLPLRADAGHEASLDRCSAVQEVRPDGRRARLHRALHQAALGEPVAGLANPRQSSAGWQQVRSEEHTSELQSLMRISYAVFCLKKKNTTKTKKTIH